MTALFRSNNDQWLMTNDRSLDLYQRQLATGTSLSIIYIQRLNTILISYIYGTYNPGSYIYEKYSRDFLIKSEKRIQKKGLTKSEAWKRLLIKGLELLILCPVFCRFFTIYRFFLISVWERKEKKGKLKLSGFAAESFFMASYS
jgi:hypothetical protein